MSRLLLLFISLTIVVWGYSQSLDSIKETVDAERVVNVVGSNEKSALPSDGDYGKFLTNKEFFLSIAILVSLLLVLAIEMWIIHTRQIHPEYAIRLIVVSLVIMGSLLLIMGGYDDQLIAPAFGLFGTISGYILGKSENSPRSNLNTNANT